MLFRNLSKDDIRSVVRHQLETIELWLRRLIDDVLSVHFGGSLAGLPITKTISQKANERRNGQPERYLRDVDALLFDDLISIICHPNLYAPYFRDALNEAFPHGADETRTFLERILEVRNPAAHANHYTDHQAMRVVCYATDVIESLKKHYARNNMAQTYNAPSFVNFCDCKGNVANISDTNSHLDFKETKLRPGEVIRFEVLPDESFDDDSYRITWNVCNTMNGETGEGRKFDLTVQNKHVSQSLPIQVKIVSNLDWHRNGNYDAMVTVMYTVLPPL